MKNSLTPEQWIVLNEALTFAKVSLDLSERNLREMDFPASANFTKESNEKVKRALELLLKP